MAEGRRQFKVGRVVSDKMEKTVVVTVDYLKPHPLYRKIIRKTNKFHAHDERTPARSATWFVSRRPDRSARPNAGR